MEILVTGGGIVMELDSIIVRIEALSSIISEWVDDVEDSEHYFEEIFSSLRELQRDMQKAGLLIQEDE